MPQCTCSFEGCDRPVFVKKTPLGPLCNGHYKQYKQLIKKGQPLQLTPLRKYTPRSLPVNGEKRCAGPGTDDQACGRPCWGAHDYCQSHQRQIWDGAKPDELTPIRHYSFQINQTCDECDEPAKARGKCARHYSQYRNKLRKQKEHANAQSQKEAGAEEDRAAANAST